MPRALLARRRVRRSEKHSGPGARASGPDSFAREKRHDTGL